MNASFASYEEYIRGRDAFLEDMQDAIDKGEDINIDDLYAVVDEADQKWAQALIDDAFAHRDYNDQLTDYYNQVIPPGIRWGT